MNDGSAPKCFREPRELEKPPFLNRHLIGIDGDAGAGKSTLAKEIRALVGGTILELDDFLCTPGQPYLAQYKAAGLKAHFRKLTNTPIIIEGVVLLDALDLLGVNADILVFATCLIFDVWNYEEYLSQPSIQPKDNSTREILDYYRRRKPWDLAQVRTVLHISF